MVKFPKGGDVMGKAVYNLSIERKAHQDIELVINEFISCGWELQGTWRHAGVHTFLTFTWKEDSNPIYPSKYQPSK